MVEDADSVEGEKTTSMTTSMIRIINRNVSAT